MIQKQLSDNFDRCCFYPKVAKEPLLKPPSQDDCAKKRLFQSWRSPTSVSITWHVSPSKEKSLKLFIVHNIILAYLGSRIISVIPIVPSFSIPWRATVIERNDFYHFQNNSFLSIALRFLFRMIWTASCIYQLVLTCESDSFTFTTMSAQIVDVLDTDR